MEQCLYRLTTDDDTCEINLHVIYLCLGTN